MSRKHHKYKSRAPEFLRDLQEQIVLYLAGNGIPSGLAEDAAGSLARHMCKHWGGQLLYFPKGESLQRSARDLKIFNDWRDGMAVPDIATKYNTSVQWAYAIVEEMRAADLARRQPELQLEGGK